MFGLVCVLAPYSSDSLLLSLFSFVLVCSCLFPFCCSRFVVASWCLGLRLSLSFHLLLSLFFYSVVSSLVFYFILASSFLFPASGVSILLSFISRLLSLCSICLIVWLYLSSIFFLLSLPSFH
ncbi:hypothetical protein C8J56DRAFT_990905 [Mycena floridula]|nr:hypothetical protein C8J56DRAFT_990905 [Mycena floridula]